MGDRLAFPREIYRANGKDGTRLSMGARLTLSALWSFARWWDDDPAATWVFPSASTLAEITGQNERSIRRQTSALSSAGLIVRENGTGPNGGRFEGWRLVRPLTEESPPDPSVREGVTEESGVGVTEESGGEDPSVREGVTEESPKEPREESGEGPDLQLAIVDPDPEPDLTGQVIAYLRDTVRALTGDPKSGPRTNATNRDLVRKATKRENATLEDWHRVIDAQRDSVRGRPETWRYLCLSTITRPRNWARLMDAPVARGHRRAARHTPSNFEPANDEGQTRTWKEIDEIPL